MDKRPTDGEVPAPDADWHRQVLETAPDAMVIVGPDERIRFANLQTVLMFGHPRQELIGEKLDVLIPERLRGGHSAHVARFFARSIARPMGSGLELFGRRADGSELAIEVSLSPVHGPEGPAVSAAIRDISARKRTEAAAQLASDRLAGALESIQEAFALFDATDSLVLCNSAYRTLFGEVMTGALIGRSRLEFAEAMLSRVAFTSEEEKERFRAARMSKGEEKEGTLDLRLMDGRSLRIIDRQTRDRARDHQATRSAHGRVSGFRERGWGGFTVLDRLARLPFRCGARRIEPRAEA